MKNISLLLDEFASAPSEFETILQRFPKDQLHWKPES